MNITLKAGDTITITAEAEKPKPTSYTGHDWWAISQRPVVGADKDGKSVNSGRFYSTTPSWEDVPKKSRVCELSDLKEALRKIAYYSSGNPIRTFYVNSKSRGGLQHKVQLWSDGKLSCPCEAYKFSKIDCSGNKKACGHIIEILDENYPEVASGREVAKAIKGVVGIAREALGLDKK